MIEELLKQLRAMPSSLNDACRTMEAAAEFIGGRRCKMTEEALVFICDEAACKEDSLFYELFAMDDRWAIIRAILKAVETAALTPAKPYPTKNMPGER